MKGERKGFGLALVVIGILMFFLPILLVFVLAFTGWEFELCFPAVMACMFLGFIILFAGSAMARGAGRFGFGGPAIPPVQYPGGPEQARPTQAPEEPKKLVCPECGAPASTVDDFGWAKCEYCGARYKVV